MNTKLELYVDLESEISKRDVLFDRDEQLKMVIVPDTDTRFYYVEVFKDYYTGGVVVYDESDNSYDFSNVGCPDFDNAVDAVDWLVTR